VEKADIAALLALGAAFFIAIGDVIHQRTAHAVTDEPVSHLGLFTRLLRDRQWWPWRAERPRRWAPSHRFARGLASVVVC
jgi:hypothetical protein